MSGPGTIDAMALRLNTLTRIEGAKQQLLVRGDGTLCGGCRHRKASLEDCLRGSCDDYAAL